MKTSPLSALPVDQLDELGAHAELKRLAQEITALDKAYYQDDTPQIDDATYDALRQRNQAIEEKFPDLKRKDSPSDRVGSRPKDGFSKVQHAVPMLSLGNAFSRDDVAEFRDRIKRFLGLDTDHPLALVAEPKIDGLSISLRYENRRFVQAATRSKTSPTACPPMPPMWWKFVAKSIWQKKTSTP